MEVDYSQEQYPSNFSKSVDPARSQFFAKTPNQMTLLAVCLVELSMSQFLCNWVTLTSLKFKKFRFEIKEEKKKGKINRVVAANIASKA